MSHQVETRRLVLRHWRPDDLAPYARLCGDKEVMAHIARGTILTEEQTGAEIRKMEKTWSERGFGTFAIEDRKTHALLGSVGFSRHDFLPDISPAVEIGFRLAKHSWNRGIATEAASAALNYGLEQLGLRDIFCLCQSENTASQQIATKLGFELVDRVKSPTYDRVILIYRR